MCWGWYFCWFRHRHRCRLLLLLPLVAMMLQLISINYNNGKLIEKSHDCQWDGRNVLNLNFCRCCCRRRRHQVVSFPSYDSSCSNDKSIFEKHNNKQTNRQQAVRAEITSIPTVSLGRPPTSESILNSCAHSIPIYYRYMRVAFIASWSCWFDWNCFIHPFMWLLLVCHRRRCVISIHYEFHASNLSSMPVHLNTIRSNSVLPRTKSTIFVQNGYVVKLKHVP